MRKTTTELFTELLENVMLEIWKVLLSWDLTDGTKCTISQCSFFLYFFFKRSGWAKIINASLQNNIFFSVGICLNESISLIKVTKKFEVERVQILKLFFIETVPMFTNAVQKNLFPPVHGFSLWLRFESPSFIHQNSLCHCFSAGGSWWCSGTTRIPGP